MFGFQRFEDVLPDIVTFAKGLTAAWLPLAGVAMRSHIQDHFRTNPLGLRCYLPGASGLVGVWVCGGQIYAR